MILGVRVYSTPDQLPTPFGGSKSLLSKPPTRSHGPGPDPDLSDQSRSVVLDLQVAHEISGGA